MKPAVVSNDSPLPLYPNWQVESYLNEDISNQSNQFIFIIVRVWMLLMLLVGDGPPPSPYLVAKDPPPPPGGV